MAKKKNAMTEKTNPVQEAIKNVDAVLDKMKGQFPLVMVVGIREDGNLDMMSNVSQFPHMQWMLSRAAFELNLYERNSLQQKQQEEVTVE